MTGSLQVRFWQALAGRRVPPAPVVPGAFPPRRVLVVRMNRLGDLICALPVARTLRANWPETRIDWLLDRQNAVLAPFLRAPGRVFVLDRGARRYWLPSGLLRALQAEQYDLTVSVKGGYDSLLAWIALAVGAPARIGYRPEVRHRFDLAYTSAVAPPPTHQHQVEKGLGLLQPLHLPTRVDDCSLEVPPDAVSRAQFQLRRHGLRADRPFAVFQLSSTKRPFMRWPLEHYTDLGRRFMASGVPVVINTVPGDPTDIALLCRALGPGAPPLAFPDMADYLGFLKLARVVIGTDGGGIHLAGAVGTHTAAFYAEAHPMKWRPWQGDHRQFYTDNRDVREVAPGQVWEAIQNAGWLDR